MTEENKQIVIGTHNGIFHCDEILGCYMLQQLPKYKNAKIVRTRDDATLAKCDIVIDVGGVFDVEKSRFDHHQKTFQHTLGSLRPKFADKWSSVRLSSAGLIYTYFGEEVIRQLLEQHNKISDASDECLRNVYEKVYEYFIQEIDGIDNGMSQYAGEPLYRVSTDLSSRVATFNSQWNSTDDYDEQAQFERAKKLVGEEFLDKVLYYATVWWPARSIVDDALGNRLELHASGRIIELKQMCPWKQHLYVLEKAHNAEGEILYCIASVGANDHRVIGIPNTANSFVCRKFLPPSWRGIRDDDLATVSKIPDSKFCHATGFVGGAKSRNAVLEMAIKAVESKEEEEKK